MIICCKRPIFDILCVYRFAGMATNVKFNEILVNSVPHQLNVNGIYGTYSRFNIQVNPETCARSQQKMISSDFNNNLTV